MFDFVKSPEDGLTADVSFDRGSKLAPTGVYANFFKRILDVTAIILAAPIIVPIVCIFVLLIKRDGGPAFYSQERIGKNGKIFTCWKLRSMIENADEILVEYLENNPSAKLEWDVNQKLRNDPRITRLGRFIRKTSIDELPQLLNIVKGEMSIVGPRPFLPNQKDLYKGHAYYTVRPGLTGLWQVSDRNETSFAERTIFDNRYAQDLTFRNDVMIVLRTFGAVVRGTGM